MIARAAAAVLAAACIVGCSQSGTVFVNGTGEAQTLGAAVLPCPAIGAIRRLGKASATVVGATAKAGSGSLRITWKATYANLTKAEYDKLSTESRSGPLFTERLVSCGALKSPVGSIGGYLRHAFNGNCNNGTCSASYQQLFQFNPPRSLKAAAKFDLVRVRRAGVGIDAVRLLVTR
jgi:hypothetical protein